MPQKAQSPGQRCNAAEASYQTPNRTKHTTRRRRFSRFAGAVDAHGVKSVFQEALPGSHLSAYSHRVAANSATGFGDPIISRRTSALHPKAGAFFVPVVSCYGGCAWGTFGCAGCLESRFANLRTAATLIRLATNRGSSKTEIGATRMHALNPLKMRAAAHRAMALAALRSRSSLSVRLSRYNNHMAIARSLEDKGVQPWA